MPGYTGTPVSKKLGITPACRIATINEPEEYRSWLAPLPDGVVFEQRVSPRTDIVHVFVTSRSELARRTSALRRTLRPDAMLWVSWPKKTARIPTTVTEDVIRDVALPLGFVDVKVCAASDVWSGLKLVVRKELRGQSK